MKMKMPKRLRGKKLDYPEKTEGSEIAASARKEASKLSDSERESHFKNAMAKIYGANGSTERVSSGH